MDDKELDKITRKFLKMICSDVDLDQRLGKILSLFPTDPPPMRGGYMHHDRQLTSGGR